MAKLTYSAIASLDGFVADEEGKFDWGEPDEEVHRFINDLERDVGTYLYGRRLYEVMVAWEGMNTDDLPPHMRDFAEIWRAADKVVYSRTLDAVTTPRNADRTQLRPRGGSEDESVSGTRSHRGRSGARRSRVQGRFGRRIPSVHRSDRGGRREAITPERCPSRARADGRTPFRNGVRLSRLPLSEVTAGVIEPIPDVELLPRLLERCGTHRVVAAVDVHHLAGDPPREVRQQERDGIGDR